MRIIRVFIEAAAWLLAMTAVADAGPLMPAILAIGGLLKAGGIGALILKGIFGAVFQLGIGLLKAALNKPKTPGVNFEVEIGDDAPIGFVTGKYATPGTRKFINTWGKVGKTPNAYLVDVIQYGDLPSYGIPGLWVNGKKATILTGEAHAEFGYPVLEFRNSNGADFLWIKVKDGTQTVADPYLLSKFSAYEVMPWLPDMIGIGCPHLIITARFEPKVHRSGAPQVLIEPPPHRWYDLRKDSTAGGSGAHRWGVPATYEPTVNLVTQAYNVIRGVYYGNEWVYGGQNLSAYRLPASAWMAAANEADVSTIAVGEEEEPQFRGGYEIRGDMEPLTVVEEFLKGCSGRLTDTGGKFKPLVGAPGAAVYSFTDGDIVVTKEQGFRPFPPPQETVNAIEATYPEPGEMWAQKDAPALYSNDLEEEDAGFRLAAGIQFNAVPYGVQVQRLMETMLAEERRFRIHTLYLSPEAYVLEPLDVVSWTSTRNGYSNKKFLIVRIDGQPGMNQLVVLKEIDPSDYGGGGDYVPIDPKPPGDFPPPPQVDPTFNAEGYAVPDAAGKPRRPSIKVTYSGDLDDVRALRVQVRLDGETEIIFDSELPYGEPGADDSVRESVLNGTFLRNEDYEVRGLLVPRSRREALWTGWINVTTPNVGVGIVDLDPDAPGVPTGLVLASAVITADPGYVTVTASWNANPAGDGVAYYDLEIKEGAGNYVSFQASGLRREFRILSGTEIDARLRAVNGLGRASAFTSVVEHTAELDTVPPAVPTGLEITPHWEGFWLEWSPNTEPDLALYEVYMHTAATPAPSVGTTPTFKVAGNQLVLSGFTFGDARWFWIRAADRSGNRSAWSALVTATVTGIEPIDIAGVVNLTSFAAGLTPVEVLASLPATGNFVGRTVMLTTDNKLYRHTGTPTNASGFTRAVDGGDILANSIVTASLAAGAVGADQIAANAIRSRHLLIANTMNLIPNSRFEDGAQAAGAAPGNWTLQNGGAAQTVVARGTAGVPANAPTAFVAKWNAAAAIAAGSCGIMSHDEIWNAQPGGISCKPGEEYRISIDAAVSGTAGGSFQLRAYGLTDAGVNVNLTVSAFAPTTSWLPYAGNFVVPAGWQKFHFWLLWAATGSGDFYWTNATVNKRNDGNLIVDGAIQAQHVSTNEIIAHTANIKDAIITNAKIVELSAAKLMAGTIMSGEVIVGGATLDTLQAAAYADGYRFGFEPDELALIPLQTGNTLTPVTTGQFSGTQSIEIRSFTPGTIDPGYSADGSRQTVIAPIPDSAAASFFGKRLRITIFAKQAAVNPSTQFALSMAAGSGGGNSGWKNFTPTGAFVGHSFYYDMPTPPTITTRAGLVIRADTSGTGKGIIVDAVSIASSTEDFAREPAERVNAGTVKITPGQIEISGGTSLADWRRGGDLTRIDGGAISANTVDANKITVGARGVTLENIEFEHNSPSANRVAWTAGNVRYINDAGVVAVAVISASNALWSSGVMYIYWVKGATTLSTTTVPATAFGQNNIVLATYQGGGNLVSTYGRTIIDGSNIKTGTITASQLITTAALITASAQIGNAVITSTKRRDLEIGRV